MKCVRPYCLVVVTMILVSASGCANSRNRLASMMRRPGGSDAFSPGEITDYRDADVINKSRQYTANAKSAATQGAKDLTLTADEKLKSLKTRTVNGFADPADEIIAKAKNRGRKALSDFPDDPFLKEYDNIIAATDRQVDSITSAARNREQTRSVTTPRASANPATARQVRKPQESYASATRGPNNVTPTGHEKAEPLLANSNADHSPKTKSVQHSREYDREIARYSDERRDDRNVSPRRDYDAYELDRNRDRYDDRDPRDSRYSNRDRDDYYVRTHGSRSRYADDHRRDDRSSGYRDDRDGRGAWDRTDARSRTARNVSRRSSSHRDAYGDDPLRPSRINYPDAESRERATSPRYSNSRHESYDRDDRSYDRRDARYDRQDPRDSRDRRYDRQDPRDPRYDNQDRHYEERDNQSATRHTGRITEFDQLFEDLERKRSRQRNQQTYRSSRRGFDDGFRADEWDNPKPKTDEPAKSEDAPAFDADDLTAAEEVDLHGPLADMESPFSPIDEEAAAQNNAPTEVEQKSMAAELVREYENQMAEQEPLPKTAPAPSEVELLAAPDTNESEFPTESPATEPAKELEVADSEDVPFPDEADLDSAFEEYAAEEATETLAVATANVHSGSLEVPENPFEANPIAIEADSSTEPGNPFAAPNEESAETVAAHDVGPNEFPEFAVPEFTVPETRPELPQVATQSPIQQTSLTDQQVSFDTDPTLPGTSPQSTLENVALEVRPDFDVMPEQAAAPHKQWFAWLIIGICSILLIYLLRPAGARV